MRISSNSITRQHWRQATTLDPRPVFNDPLIRRTHYDRTGNCFLTDKSTDRRVKRRCDLSHDQYRGHLLAAFDRRQHADANAGPLGQRFQR